MKADLVLEGGGVKGLGLVGAVLRLMREGYTFPRVAGTSAGSILAAFLAAGMTADQLADAMQELDYSRVPDRPPGDIPLIGPGVALLRGRGLYKGDYIYDFVHDALKELGVTTFRDLRRKDDKADKNLEPYRKYKLVVMTTDITRGRMLRLPWDYPLLNLEPDDQLVADAVRASLSIPVFFESATIRDGKTGEETSLVDGGILSNFPIEAFDRTDGDEPRWPTLGVKVIPALPAGDAQLFPGLALPRLPLFHLLEQVVATAMVGHDQTYLEQPCVSRRAIRVDTEGVGIVDFDIDRQRRDALVATGDAAAGQFLDTWDWERFKEECGASVDPSSSPE